jgi:predicted flap endonuclease-1-like 5' DNA nuclease
MAKLISIEGIGQAYASQLKEAGITTTEALLEKGSTRIGRAEIAEKSGISPALILKWVSQGDLMRIKGIGPTYADLLEQAGIDSVGELAQRNPHHLHQRLMEANLEKKLVRKLPYPPLTSDWITQAKKLPSLMGELPGEPDKPDRP